MNQYSNTDLSGQVGGVSPCVFVIAPFEHSADNAGYSAAPCLVYQALTAIRKDCGRIGKKHRRIWRDKSRHSFELAAVIAPARSGNGEQPWL